MTPAVARSRSSRFSPGMVGFATVMLSLTGGCNPDAELPGPDDSDEPISNDDDLATDDDDTTDDDDDSAPDDDPDPGLLTPCDGTLVGTLSLEEVGLRIDGLGGIGQRNMFGWAVAGIGDLNADGTADLLVGAPISSGGREEAAHLYYLGPQGQPDGGEPVATFHESPQGRAELGIGDAIGQGVAPAGDVNGDGTPDFIASRHGSGDSYIVSGTVEGVVQLGDAPGWTFVHPTPNDPWEDCPLNGPVTGNQGRRAGDADINGDGWPDFVTALWWYAGPCDEPGTVGVFYGPFDAEVSHQDADAVIVGENQGDLTGWVVETIPDLDGDGFDTLAVVNGDTIWTSGGVVYLFDGPLAGDLSLSDADATLTDLAGAGQFLAGGYDVTGDGIPDIAAATQRTRREDPEVVDVGHTMYVAPGPFSGPYDLVEDAHALRPSEVSPPSGPTNALDLQVAMDGDFNGDGINDLLVGNRLQRPPEAADHERPGAAYVFYGPIVGDANLEDAQLILEGERQLTEAGRAVDYLGDVDGDGTDDIVVGAPEFELEDGTRPGSVYVVFGQPCTER